MFSSFRPCLAFFTAALLLSPFSLAYQSPLSDEAVREAYFLGQRHDDSMARLLNCYTKVLPPPATGPHIYSVTFLTPFALLVQYSSRQSNYSAQQAEKDHYPDAEIVSIQIQVFLTPSYGAVIPTPTSTRSGSPIGYQLRPSVFWKDVKVEIFDGEKKLSTDSLSGEPTYFCSDGCILSGANIRLEFLATAFTSATATIHVLPPDGDPVSVDFDLSTL